MPKLKEDLRETIFLYLKHSISVCLAADFWSSIALDSYLGITCTIIDSKWERKRFMLAAIDATEKSHTAGNIETFLSISNYFINIKEFKIICSRRNFKMGYF